MTSSPQEPLGRAQQEVSAALEPDRPARFTRSLTYLLEDLLPVPGTKFRFGLDPVLSLVPWAGTVTAAVLGSAVLIDAVRLRMPIPVLLRMLGNWTIDWLVGLVPFAGPLLDVAWRSNRKNLALLHRTIADREQVRKASVTYWIVAGSILASMIAMVVAIPLLVLWWLVQS